MKRLIKIFLLIIIAFKINAQSDESIDNLPEKTTLEGKSTELIYLLDSVTDKHFTLETLFDVIADTAVALRAYADALGLGDGYFLSYIGGSSLPYDYTIYPYKYSNYFNLMLGNNPTAVFAGPGYDNPYRLYVDGISYFSDSIQFSGELIGLPALIFTDSSGSYTLSQLSQEAWNIKLTEDKWLDLNSNYTLTISDTATESPKIQISAILDYIRILTNGYLQIDADDYDIYNDSTRLRYNKATGDWYLRDSRNSPAGLRYYADYRTTSWDGSHDLYIPDIGGVKAYINDSILSGPENYEILYQNSSGEIDGVTNSSYNGTFFQPGADLLGSSGGAFRIRYSSSINPFQPTYCFNNADSVGLNPYGYAGFSADIHGDTTVIFLKDSTWFNVPIKGNHGISGIVDTTDLPITNELAVFTAANKIGGYSDLTYSEGNYLTVPGLSITGMIASGVLYYTSGEIASENNFTYNDAEDRMHVQKIRLAGNTSHSTTDGLEINGGTYSYNVTTDSDDGYTYHYINTVEIMEMTDTGIIDKEKHIFEDTIYYPVNLPSDTAWAWFRPTDGAMILDSLTDAGFALNEDFYIPTIQERLNDRFNGEIPWYYKDRKGNVIKEYNIHGSPGKVIQKLQSGQEITLRQMLELENKYKKMNKEIIELKKSLIQQGNSEKYNK